MRKILIVCFLLSAIAARAQLNNSWIDYGKTYYKFKSASSGLFRITQPTLSSLGLGATPAQNFQLWRNGQEVRLYTSVSSGVLGSGDYLEFYGKANDGQADKQLYRKAEFQLCDSFSLSTDTATYFLTVNASGSNLRYVAAVNNVGSNTLSPETYFFRRVSKPFRTQVNRGYAEWVGGEYVYSASYENGEGWTSDDIYSTQNLSQRFSDLNVYTGAPDQSVSVYVSAFGNANNPRHIMVKLFDSVVIDEPMNILTSLKKQVDGLSMSLLKNPSSADLYVYGNSSNLNDRIVVAEIALTYPATFNFNNQANFYFELKASPAGNYLEIDNFNAGSLQPVLYDLTNNKRYLGDISTPGKVKFALDASLTARKLMLMSQATSNVNIVTGMVVRNFIDYSAVANQGDYMIISNPLLYNDGNGVNYVDQYRQYRSSINGGSYDAKVFSINELVDQFAFGINYHPSSIRDFIRFSSQQFSVKPKYVFLLGRGTSYSDQRLKEGDPSVPLLNLVPTFGWPASDVLLSCSPGTYVPLVPVGRLSVINGNEISVYLDKVKQYESAQLLSSPLIADKAWMKNFIHVIGGKDETESQLFASYMNNLATIAQDTLMGAKVESFKKESTAAIDQANGERIKELMKEGTGVIGYFGHSSANTLEYNLSNPEDYDNDGKYPFFNVSGCTAGNLFTFDPSRLTDNKTLSEKYVLAPHRGSIAFLASTHLGIPPYLYSYDTFLYNAMCNTLYGNTIGNQIKQTIQNLAGNISESEFFVRMHVEEITLHGDPALHINSSSLPDFVIDDPSLKISPSVISVADNNFTVGIKMMNLGKAVNDSIRILVKRKLPNDTVQVIYNARIPAIKYIDSLNFTIPINSITDKGLNQLSVFLDADNTVQELYETNNSITKDFYIFEDELRPVYPYNYSIVHKQNITYTASTANPLLGQRQYLMEIDTTELFNSAFKKQYTVLSVGGAIQFTPANLTFADSTVYYWRTSIVPLGSEQPIWNAYSFVYLSQSSDGFNQSHYYQHLKSTYSDITLDADRIYRFKRVNRNLQIRTGLYPYFVDDAIDINLDFEKLDYYGCHYNELQFAVFDTTTLMPWKNYPVNNGTSGRFGSLVPCNDGGIHPEFRYFFEFPYEDSASRRKAMDFLDSIPDGMYVSITNLATAIDVYATPYKENKTFISDWQADQATLGTGKSLYHKLKSIGFTKIDSFYRNIPFLYFFKKNSSSFASQQFVGASESEHIEETFELPSFKSKGTIESPLYGPASKWYSLHWRDKSFDPVNSDSVYIEVYGVKTDGSSELKAVVSPATDTTLSFIDAKVYPYVKLKMYNSDTVLVTPGQLGFWRVNADYLPEGAIAPNIHFSMKDTVDQGEPIDFSIAFKNISSINFDSLKVKFVITDKYNVPVTISIPRQKALVAGDTVVLYYTIDTKSLAGSNTLYVMFNPDNDQPENVLFNNFIFKDFYVREDKYNPLLDVTFDGVHILNRDIVSASPNIHIRLMDENKYVNLSDTALLKNLMKVQVLYPDGTTHNYYFGDSLRLLTSSEPNVATIEFIPSFPMDGEYQLIISGKDANGNKAGYLEYRVVFEIINKPMISNFMNYPNPFTTSTAFVFTVTGSEVPQHIRIQILTITGKIVREISTEELGPIHIGRNITEFKWDGTDSYGQKLANGVYLYRVLTNLNGKSMSKYQADGDKTDQYFNKGYGKMYLMR